MAVALKPTPGVLTTLLTTSVVHTALIYVSTVGQSIQAVPFVANTLKTTRGVHTRVTTCPFEITLVYILTGALVSKQLEALPAVTLKAADGVPAEVVATAVVQLTLINVFARLPVRLQSEAHRAAAAYARGCVLTRGVTPPVIYRTVLHEQSALDTFVHLSEGRGVVIRALSSCLVPLYTGPAVRVQGVPHMTPADGPLLHVLTGVLAAPVTMVTGQDAASLVLGQLESWAALAGHSSLGCLLADVSTAMLLIHTAKALHRAVDTCVLVVTEEEALFTAALITPHGVATCMLAPSIVEDTLVHI